jgi:3-deoxy-D-arabino-heptulosonate 7-phosphate (DAHP) synthase
VQGTPAVAVQRVVRVRYRTTLAAFAKVVKALEPLRYEERRRVINASAVAVGVDAIHIEAHPNAALCEVADKARPN